LILVIGIMVFVYMRRRTNKLSGQIASLKEEQRSTKVSLSGAGDEEQSLSEGVITFMPTTDIKGGEVQVLDKVWMRSSTASK